MGEINFAVFNKSASTRLKDIIRNGTWLLPNLLKDSFPICYKAIMSTPLIDSLDLIIWKDKSHVSSLYIKEALFSHLSEVGWFNDVWFKGFSINFMLYCWHACVGGFETSNKLSARGLGHTLVCYL